MLIIIKGNFLITKKQRNDLKKELSDFIASLEFIERELEQKVENQEKYLDTLDENVQEIYDYQQDTYHIQDKPVELEDRSHRNNLQIDGIMEEKEKTWDISKDKVKEIFSKNVGIEKTFMVNIG